MTYKLNIKMPVLLCRLFSILLIAYHSIGVYGESKSFTQTFAFTAFVFGFWWLGYESRSDAK